MLAGVSFEVAPGAVLVLRGPNGIGKTTLLRTLAGLQPAAGGRIEIAPDSIAYAAHSDGLKAQLSVRENLMFWAHVFDVREAARAVNRAIGDFNLAALADRRAHALSAGQKRRLGLARLLVAQRPLWILDEPTVSLDRESVAIFAGAVRRHCEERGAALIATHIDLGLEARSLDLSPFRPVPGQGAPAADAAFLGETFG